jgi:hypothetical protein
MEEKEGEGGKVRCRVFWEGRWVSGAKSKGNKLDASQRASFKRNQFMCARYSDGPQRVYGHALIDLIHAS